MAIITASSALPILHLLSQMDLLLIAGWKAVSWVQLSETWQMQSLANLNNIHRMLCNQVCYKFLQTCLNRAIAVVSCLKACTYHTLALLSLHTMFCTVNVSCCSVQPSHSLTAYLSPCESCLVLHMCLLLLYSIFCRWTALLLTHICSR